jgi:hypothetical protein
MPKFPPLSFHPWSRKRVKNTHTHTHSQFFKVQRASYGLLLLIYLRKLSVSTTPTTPCDIMPV